MRVKGAVNLFNVFNANDPYQLNYAYGPSWLTSTNIMLGRLVKFNLGIDF